MRANAAKALLPGLLIVAKHPLYIEQTFYRPAVELRQGGTVLIFNNYYKITLSISSIYDKLKKVLCTGYRFYIESVSF